MFLVPTLQRKQLMVASDEVNARGIFPSTDIPDPKSFISMLSFEIEKFINPSLVHVLYGMSKVCHYLPLFPSPFSSFCHPLSVSSYPT